MIQELMDGSIWFKIAIFCTFLEVCFFSGFLISFAASSMLVALIMHYFGPIEMNIQVATFCISSITMCFLFWRFKPNGKDKIDITIDVVGSHLIGRTVTIGQFDGQHYHFTIDGAPWKGVSFEPLSEGQEVKIACVQNAILELEALETYED